MDSVHPIEPTWRLASAAVQLARAEAVAAFLAHLEDNLDLFDYIDDEEVVSTLRGVRGLMRSRYADLKGAGEKIEAEMASGSET